MHVGSGHTLQDLGTGSDDMTEEISRMETAASGLCCFIFEG